MNREWIIESPDMMVKLCAFFGRFKIEKPLRITATPYIVRRTKPQNSRLWKLHTLASEVTGYSPEEMHEHSLCRFFGFEEVPVTNPITGAGEIKRVPLKRSSQRNKVEFGKYMEATEIWYGQEFGVWLGG